MLSFSSFFKLFLRVAAGKLPFPCMVFKRCKAGFHWSYRRASCKIETCIIILFLALAQSSNFERYFYSGQVSSAELVKIQVAEARIVTFLKGLFLEFQGAREFCSKKVGIARIAH